MLKVSFGEAMAAEGKYAIDDIEKYMLLGTPGGTKTLKSIKNVTLTIVDNGKAVEIKVPSEEDNEDDGFDILASYDLRIARVADAAGNYTDDMSFDKDIDAAGTIAIEKAEATARNTIEVTFADEVKFEVADFTVTDGVYGHDFAAVETTLNDKGKTVATFTLIDDDKLDSEFNNGDVYIDVVADPETENRYGMKVDTANETVLDKIAPELYSDGDDDTDYGENNTGVKDYLLIGAADSYEFTIFFSEDMTTALDYSYTGADFIIELDGDQLRNGRDYVVTDITDNAVTFEFTDSFKDEVKEGDPEVVVGYEVKGDLTIKLVEEPDYIMDMNDNAPKAFDTIEFDELLFENDVD
jgi:hypothetical protein